MAVAPHDMHGVDDLFAQLPLICGAAKKTPTAPASRDAAGIRLFSRDFPNDQQQQQAAAAHQLLLLKEDAATGDDAGAEGGETAAAGSGETRKFECHYCCRNFPTSQALGGHQNAHKRERQHARRAHLEASFAAHCGAYLPGGAHLYGLFGYDGGGGTALPPVHYPQSEKLRARLPPARGARRRRRRARLSRCSARLADIQVYVKCLWKCRCRVLRARKCWKEDLGCRWSERAKSTRSSCQ